MKIKIKPKSYGPIFVHIDEQGEIRYGLESEGIDDVNPPSGSPAELLLASLGACIAISIRVAATSMKVEIGAFHVAVRTDKAEDPPSRFGRFDMRVTGLVGDDPSAVEALLSRAKSLCTVSNTLHADITLQVAD